MRKIPVLAAAAILGLATAPAYAVDNGIYLGASVGQSGVSYDETFEGQDFSFDADSTGFKAIAGWRFLDWLSVEANYVDLGSGDDHVAGEKLEADASGLSLSAVGFVPIGPVDLFARVGAYYHDIGKMLKPSYFIENQNYMENSHNHIKPSLSNSVLKAHVKQGLELADKWKLPKAIKDMIQQHHGKSLMIYFYNSALKSESSVNEQDYRYPGPTPKFKESAILSLADTIEAMTRTLKNPTPARISELVNNAIKKKIMDGELDDSELTLKEINLISESFVRILTTMYHTRIEYPDEKELKNNEETMKKKTETAENPR